jgi:hypothetical protein
MMKKVVVMMFVWVIGFSSCEVNPNLYERINKYPEVSILDANSEEVDGYIQVNDSIKVGVWRSVGVKASDEGKVKYWVEGLNGLEVYLISETGDTIEQGSYLNKIQANLMVKSSELGNYDGEVNIEDQMGKVKTVRLNLKSIINKSPVCVVGVVKINDYSEYEIEIDLTGSYDRDARLGGGIEEYEYVIGNYYTLRTKKYSKIRHVLPGEGSHNIKCRVRDNDGAWSEYVYKEVKI